MKTPEQRERDRANSRRWLAKPGNAERERARKRRRYAEHREQEQERVRVYRLKPGVAEREDAYAAEYRARPEVKVRQKQSNRIYRIENYESKAERLRKLKDAPCMDCGNRFPPECMDFDHVRGVKAFEISRAAARTEEAVRAELAKCDLVCANCHRIRTRKRLGVRHAS